MSIILGIDPGFACLGWAEAEISASGDARLVSMGVLQTIKSDKKRGVLASDDNLRRARELHAMLDVLVLSKAGRALCCESMSFPRSASVAAKMAMAWGVLASIAEHRALPIVQASPKEIKRAVCGTGSASKDEVQAALCLRFPDALGMVGGLHKAVWEHCFDALGAVVACLSSDVVRALRGT